MMAYRIVLDNHAKQRFYSITFFILDYFKEFFIYIYSNIFIFIISLLYKAYQRSFIFILFSSIINFLIQTYVSL